MPQGGHEPAEQALPSAGRNRPGFQFADGEQRTTEPERPAEDLRRHLLGLDPRGQRHHVPLRHHAEPAPADEPLVEQEGRGGRPQADGEKRMDEVAVRLADQADRYGDPL